MRSSARTVSRGRSATAFTTTKSGGVEGLHGVGLDADAEQLDAGGAHLPDRVVKVRDLAGPEGRVRHRAGRAAVREHEKDAALVGPRRAHEPAGGELDRFPIVVGLATHEARHALEPTARATEVLLEGLVDEGPERAPASEHVALFGRGERGSGARGELDARAHHRAGMVHEQTHARVQRRGFHAAAEHAAAVRGVRAQSAFSMASWACHTRLTPVTAFETLLNTAFVPDAQQTHARLRTTHQSFHIHDAMELIGRLGIADRPLCRSILHGPGLLTEDELKSVKRAMVLHDWIQEKKLDEIEKKHFLWAGTIHQLAADFARLLDAQAAIAELVGWPGERVAVLHALAERLKRGVRTDLPPLSRRAVPGLGRTFLRWLASAGITTEEELRATDVEKLAVALRHSGLARKVCAALAAGDAAYRPAPAPLCEDVAATEGRRALLQRPADAPTSCIVAVHEALGSPPADAAIAPAPPPAPRLRFTSHYWNRRCRVELDGKAIALSVKVFVVLALLAFERLNYGWKSIQRLRERLAAVLGEAGLRLIENDGHGHYRLALTVEQIELLLAVLAANKAPAVQALVASLKQQSRA